MSDLGDGAPGFSVGGFLSQAVEEGWSARRAIAEFRDAGMRMSNESFRSMYNNARDALANRDVIAGLDYNAIPSHDVFTPWAAGEEGNYATFVESFVRLPGEREVESRFYVHVTADPHTPQDAIDAAAAIYTDESLPTGGTPQGSYVGSVVTSVTRTTGGA